MNHEVLKNNLPAGIWYNFQENGHVSNIQIVGVFPKTKLKEMKEMFPNIPINKINKIDEPYFGIPSNSLKCKLLPFLKNCS
jgi:hypothetical protein